MAQGAMQEPTAQVGTKVPPISVQLLMCPDVCIKLSSLIWKRQPLHESQQEEVKVTHKREGKETSQA